MEMVPQSKAAQEILKCGEAATEVRAEKVVKEYSSYRVGSPVIRVG